MVFFLTFSLVQGNAGFQPGGGIASSGHGGYGAGYNTFGTNVYYGGRVGGAYGITRFKSAIKRHCLIAVLLYSLCTTASPSHYGR